MGEKEQALLICDVYPDMEKGKPNAESMLDALSIVAHIPIFEEKILGEECEKCKKFVLEGLNERREKTIKELIQIKKYCEDHSGNGREIGIEKYLLTYDDNKDSMNEVLKAMTDLGKHYHSEWFVRRAEYYEKFYKMYPQAWPPQTFTDWLYVEVDYSEFLENKIGYRIEMPERE